MKRTCLVLAAILLTFLMADARTVKKVYEIDGFTGISAADAIEVTLEQGDSFRIEVEVTEEFLPYLVVKNRAGVLDMHFSRLPFALKQKNRNKVAQVYIQVPVLNHVTLSGASKLTCNDTFAIAMGKFSLSASGGSTVSSLSIKAPDVDMQLSGASRATVSVRSSDMRAALSGASRLDVVGHGVDLSVNASGSSRLSAEAFEVEEADVKASGASTVDVLPTRVLKVALSGASRCRYHGDADDLQVKAEKVTGASSLKHAQ